MGQYHFWVALLNTSHIDEKPSNNNIVPSYLPMLCQHSTIRSKDSTCIIQLSTILFGNGSFKKERKNIYPPIVNGVLIQLHKQTLPIFFPLNETVTRNKLPPTRYMLHSLATSESFCVDSPGIFSAYSLKYWVPYGELKHSQNQEKKNEKMAVNSALDLSNLQFFLSCFLPRPDMKKYLRVTQTTICLCKGVDCMLGVC